MQVVTDSYASAALILGGAATLRSGLIVVLFFMADLLVKRTSVYFQFVFVSSATSGVLNVVSFVAVAGPDCPVWNRYVLSTVSIFRRVL